MKRINRRDYLLQMGAGAAGLMAASRIDVLAGHRQPFPTQRPENLLFKPTTSLPPNPRVTLILGGLFGFFYNSNTGNSEIGVHKGADKHKLMIEVWERNSQRCKRIRWTEDGTLPRPNGDLKIEIAGRATSDANFYMVGPYDRSRLDPKDFRWLPDLESDDFYPNNPPKLNGQFKHKLVVRHGSFYTYQRTRSTFYRIDPPEGGTPNTVDFFQVADYMAAAIDPNQNEDVVFQVKNNSALVLKDKPGFTYQIVILNHCYQNDHDKCVFQPNDPHETERNDFHFMRKLLQLSANDKLYGLKLKDKRESSPTFCTKDPEKTLTDEAPCMGAAFGKTNGMPN